MAGITVIVLVKNEVDVTVNTGDELPPLNAEASDEEIEGVSVTVAVNV